MRKPWSEAVSARAVGESIKSWFRSPQQPVLGLAREGSRVYMSLVDEEEGSLRILWQDMVEIGGEPVQDSGRHGQGSRREEADLEEHQETDWTEEELWELACLKAADHVPEQAICSLALDEQQVYYYERFFPDMKPGELEQAVRLDFAAASAWQEKFYCSYQAIGQGMLRVGGIKEKDLTARLKVLQKEYGLAQGVLVCHGEVREAAWDEGEVRDDPGQEGFRRAMYAAVCSLRNQGMVFRPYREYICRWNWLHLTQALWGAAMIALAVFWGTGWYMQQDVDAQAAQWESRLELMRDIDGRERKIAGDRQTIDHKNQVLAQLSQAPRRGQGLLTELGYGLGEDIWLTEVKALGDGTLAIQGRGALYGDISAMVDKLNSHRNGSGQTITLENADMAQDGRIDFRLRGRV